ncbi:FAD/NAD(P)-binding protein [Nocardioides sp.]|uniref:FAD/NAD(P)-binding protein n=1 Tax=Nocardioides sp. TaxID=35761 RepID=UPI0039E5B634
MTVAIVGGGASGVLTAINLLSATDDPQLDVVIFESSGIVGRGIAYGTTDQRHLLNVRARHMSAFPDHPADLLDWSLRTGRSQDPQSFLPRADYASYLQDRLRDVADDRLRIHAGKVIDIARTTDDTGGARFEVATARTTTAASHVVLAYGNLPPRPLAAGDHPLPEADWHLGNPWDLGRLRTLPADAHVLVVGTGLTAVDTAITLLEEGPNRHVTMVSRHGVLPEAHIAQTHVAWVTKVPEGPLTADLLARTVRDEIEAARDRDVDWRPVIDGLRPATQDIWLRLPQSERERFLAVYARDWEVRRHRMAREIADRVDGYRADGRLTVRQGTLVEVSDQGEVADVVIEPGEPALRYHAVVNCTGPLTDLSRSDSPLLQALHTRGLARPDPLRLGLHTTVDGELIGADDAVVPGLFSVGPPRKGTLWESTAIPEIRAQAAQLAARIVKR